MPDKNHWAGVILSPKVNMNIVPTSTDTLKDLIAGLSIYMIF
jgi:hypothetical protein